MKVILDKAIEEINSIIADEMKNLDDIETKIMMKERKMIIKRSNFIHLNELEIKINAEIEILENEEKKGRSTIDCLKRSKADLLDLYKKKKKEI